MIFTATAPRFSGKTVRRRWPRLHFQRRAGAGARIVDAANIPGGLT